jgi:hypothetical protein
LAAGFWWILALPHPATNAMAANDSHAVNQPTRVIARDRPPVAWILALGGPGVLTGVIAVSEGI